MRAALIGLGHHGKKTYLPALQKFPHIKLVGVCDRDPTTLEDVIGELNKYTSYRELFEKEHLDFIVVATSHDAYPEIVVCAAEKGIHILKEKPFARTFEEGRFFQKIAEKNNIYLRTYPQRRFNSAIQKIPEFLIHIGDPFMIDIQYTLFVEDPHSGWRGFRKTAGGGCIIDMGYHMIDLLITYFGLPSDVYASFSAKAIPSACYDCEDTAVIHFSYQNGLYGSMLLSRYLPPKTEKIRILGSNGFIEINKNEIHRFSSRGVITESHAISIETESLFSKQIEHFCKLLNGEIQESNHFREQLEVLSFIQTCYESKVKKRSINPHIYMENYMENKLCLN